MGELKEAIIYKTDSGEIANAIQALRFAQSWCKGIVPMEVVSFIVDLFERREGK